MKLKILIVEDEKNIARFLELELKHEQFETFVAYDGRTGLDLATSQNFDCILLDVMLPELNGIEVCRRIRKSSDVPILLLTARDAVMDRVAGLDAGADDYIPKPFEIEDFLARIRAMTRRRGEIAPDGELLAGDLILQTSNLKLIKGDKEVKLTLKESQLIELLFKRMGMSTSKELIIERLWGYDSEAEHNNVEVYISFLRKKLSYLHSSIVINTIRGVGYILEEK